MLAAVLLASSCSSGEQSNTSPPWMTSPPSTTSPADPVSVVYDFMDAYNRGDREQLDLLWSADAVFAGGRRIDDPAIEWVIDLAMDGLHEQITGDCHATENDVVYCDELHLDDLIRPAGVAWRSSRVYTFDSGKIAGYTEVETNRSTVDDYYGAFITWMATAHPDVFERAFDLEQDIVWRSVEGTREAIDLVDEFLAQSADYPLVPPERLEDPELTATVEPGVEVWNGEPHQIELVEWGFGRYRLAGLDPPPVASVTFPPHAMCSNSSGWAIDNGEDLWVVMCLYEAEMCADEECSELSSVARVVFLHELAHAWTSRFTDDETKQRFLDLRGLEQWYGAGLAWGEQGWEHAAEIVMWGLMDRPVDVFRLGNPTCEELEEGFRLLTGAEPLHGVC